MSLYYASPTGLSSNSGAIGSPWDLTTALANVSQTSGDTLYLRGNAGSFTGKFRSTLAGGTVRSYPGEWAVLDGYLVTTLTANVPNQTTQTTISVASTIGIGVGDEIIIDDESMHVVDVHSSTSLSATRRQNGTTAAAHTSGATVYLQGDQLRVLGSNTTYQGFEVKNSLTDRVYSSYRSNASGLGVFALGSGNSYINLIIHDNNGGGIFTGSSSSNTTIYGCLVYNNGTHSGPHGHGLYLENASGYSRIYNNIVLNNFNLGAQFYGVTGPFVGGDIRYTTIAGSGLPAGVVNYNLIWGPDSVASPTAYMDSNVFQHQPSAGYSVLMGYASGVTSATVTNNYFLGAGGSGVSFAASNAVGSLTFTGNKLDNTGSGQLVSSYQNAYTWNNNYYYTTPASGGGSNRFIDDTLAGQYNFASWQSSTGFDATSTRSSSAMPDTVIVRPNTYEIGRANITIYAPSLPASINVDLATTGLVDGQAYTIKNAFDYFGDDVATGVYDAGSTTISLPLNGAALDVATPTGMGSTPATTVPQFGAFIVIPGAADVSAPGTPTGLTANVGQSSGATGTMLLAWTLGAGTETSVTVRRIVDGVTTDIPLAADVTSYTDTGQTVGLSYTYAVKASNAAGDSAWSDTAQEVLTGLTCFGAPPSIG